MSQAEKSRFCRVVKEDTNLQDELARVKTDAEKQLAIVQKHGFDCSLGEFKEVVQELTSSLSDEELDAATGADSGFWFSASSSEW